MTRDEIEEAVCRATAEAFDLGVRHGRDKKRTTADQLRTAQEYGLQRVMPIVDLALDRLMRLDQDEVGS